MVIEETEAVSVGSFVWVALFIALAGILLYKRSQQVSLSWITTLAGMVALATLAGGHAVMHDGIHYYLHLFSDLVHLVAAGTWVGSAGGLCNTVAAVKVICQIKQFVEVVSESLAGFATVQETIAVALSLSCDQLCILPKALFLYLSPVPGVIAAGENQFLDSHALLLAATGFICSNA